MWIHCAVLVLLIHSTCCQNFSIPVAEETAFRAWAQNATKLSNWNFLTHPCTWKGITCVKANGSNTVDGIYNITIEPNTQASLIYGELPDLAYWEQLKLSGTAFTRLQVLNFINYRFGPFFPDYIDRMWTNGNNTAPNSPWNLNISNYQATSVLCPLPPPFDNPVIAAKRLIGCTNINIVEISPTHGPKTGGTIVTVQMNSPAAFVNLKCSFGALDDQLTELAPITEVYFLDYYWKDYYTPTYQIGTFFSTSIIRCVSPPHPEGPVDFRLVAELANGTRVLLTRDSYKIIFNYECPAGTKSVIANGTTVCDPCPVGYWSPLASDTCYPCAEGSYSDKPGTGRCTLCPAGTFGNTTSQTSRDQCNFCSPGFYTSAPGSPECDPCDPGTAQPKSGQITCVNCKPGSVAPGYGNENCSTCASGSYSPSSIEKCALCPVGTFSAANGSSTCKSCPPGVTTSGLGKTECDVTCGPGYYRSVDLQRCVECAPGWFSNGSGLVVCQLCPVGQYNPNYNATKCEDCPEGTLNVNKGSTECFKKNPPPPPPDNTGLIIGIILLVLAIVGIAIAIIIIIKLRRDQMKKQTEIEEIRKIMNGLK